MLLSFYHTCASKQHHDLHDRESPMLSLSYTSGNFSLQNLACIFQWWASSKCPRSSLASKLDAHPLSFFCWAFIHSQLQCIRCMAIPTPHVDINRWASPQPFDQPRQCEIFSFFVFSTQPPSSYSIPSIVLYPSPTLMYCVRVKKAEAR